MLRISTIESADNGTTLRLEGHLTGPWIAELAAACEQALGARRSLTLDLGEVALIDRPGVALLASLSRRSVALVRYSPFQGEQLRQAAAAQPTTNRTPQ
jgi:ABC-type transporter Mla MlaB component